jgi:hypothetical protein
MTERVVLLLDDVLEDKARFKAEDEGPATSESSLLAPVVGVEVREDILHTLSY